MAAIKRAPSLVRHLESNRKANLSFCSKLGWESGAFAPPAAGQGLSRDADGK